MPPTATARGPRSVSAPTSSSHRGGRWRNRWCLACSTHRGRTRRMAAPKYAPVPPSESVRAYESPEYVPEAWKPDRPAEIEGRQPEGMRLGYQGPDQGYAFTLGERFRGRIHAGDGVSVDDALRGSLNIALRRASLFGRAPVVHDISLACAIWGWLHEQPPADVAQRR